MKTERLTLLVIDLGSQTYPRFCWCWSCACLGRPGGFCGARLWPTPWMRSWVVWCEVRCCSVPGVPCRPVPRQSWRLLLAKNNTDVVYLQSHSVPYSLGTPEQEESGRKPLIKLVMQGIHQHISVTGAEPESWTLGYERRAAVPHTPACPSSWAGQAHVLERRTRQNGWLSNSWSVKTSSNQMMSTLTIMLFKCLSES